jgi:hypothetical protein
MNGTLFLTGVTGYIGSSLLKKYLDDTDMKMNLLVRSRRDRNPADRLQAVLEELYPGSDPETFADRLMVLEGDITLTMLSPPGSRASYTAPRRPGSISTSRTPAASISAALATCSSWRARAPVWRSSIISGRLTWPAEGMD